MKRYSELVQEINNHWEIEYKAGRITRGFVNVKEIHMVQELFKTNYDLVETHLRNFRDFVVMYHAFSSTDKYEPAKQDCMSAVTHIIDMMLCDLGCGV